MMITKEEFFKAFRDCMTGQMSTKEFARQAIQYMNSPDYNRWKAERTSQELRAQKEGRQRLFQLIEEARKAPYRVDYEIVPLKDGHDSILVQIRNASVGFPFFFDKRAVEEQWTEFIERLKANIPCGMLDCSVSTAIDDETLTFGRGELDNNGYWQYPCAACAEAYHKKDGKRPVWPVKNAPQ